MPSQNKEYFTSFFQIFVFFIYFPCFLTQARVSSTILNRISEVYIPYLHLKFYPPPPYFQVPSLSLYCNSSLTILSLFFSSSPISIHPLQWYFKNINVTMLPLLKIILWFPLFLGIKLKILNMSCNTLHDSRSLCSYYFTFCAPATQTFCFLECVAFHLASGILHKFLQ